MQAKEPLKTALLMLPWLFGGTVASVLALVLLKAELTAWWPAWLHASVVFSVGLAVAAVVQLFLVPKLRARILKDGHIGEVRLLRHATVRFHCVQGRTSSRVQIGLSSLSKQNIAFTLRCIS